MSKIIKLNDTILLYQIKKLLNYLKCHSEIKSHSHLNKFVYEEIYLTNFCFDN